VENHETWQKKVTSICKRICKKNNIPLAVVQANYPWSKSVLNNVGATVQALLRGEKTTLLSESQQHRLS